MECGRTKKGGMEGFDYSNAIKQRVEPELLPIEMLFWKIQCNSQLGPTFPLGRTKTLKKRKSDLYFNNVN